MDTKEPVFTSDLNVRLVQSIGTDRTFAAAARTCSDNYDAAISDDKVNGIIRTCMEKRHGSVFEAAMMTFVVTCPIFVWREIHRHRIASYNEQSARYKPMEPVFYIPPNDRPFFKITEEKWKPMTPKFRAEDIGNVDDGVALVNLFNGIKQTCRVAYQNYLIALKNNLDPGIARAMMPVNTMSTGWITMNPRGLMNFFSLRIFDADAKYPSHPLWEIEQIAHKMENEFAQQFPITHQHFCQSGRVAP